MPGLIQFMKNTIFVQMASYRDPQLVATLLDLIERAEKPERLRIVVCWQHAPNETLAFLWHGGFTNWQFETSEGRTIHFLEYQGAKLELIDVPHLESRGVCWARNMIQQRYDGERYTLQLDSHHRFVGKWDQQIIDMLESVRDESPKPVLTAYLPDFDPDDPSSIQLINAVPGALSFLAFNPEGVVMFNAQEFPGWKTRDYPMRARFYSGHFAFADGHFAECVQHDPEYFFFGEEISIAVRAFTHGYDLYNPHRVLAWHDYTRKHRVKVWEDHTPQTKESTGVASVWWELDNVSIQRNQQLFGMNDNAPVTHTLGKYGFGSERTLSDYEAYAGISFRYRGVQQAALDNLPPVPNARLPESEAEWKASQQRSNEIRACQRMELIDKNAAEQEAQKEFSSASSGKFTVYDTSDKLIYQQKLDASFLTEHLRGEWISVHPIFLSEIERIPAYYVIELTDDFHNVIARGKSPVKN
jgi:hypothetical protein